MYRLVPALVREMGQAYPGARPRRAAHHRDPAARGDPLPQDPGARPRRSSTRRRRTLGQGQNLSGEVAFTLYDTYGFPLDLTQDALKARGIGVDTDDFKAAMERQRAEGARGLVGLGRGRDRDRLVRHQGARRRDRIPGLRHRDAPRASCSRSCKDGKEVEELKAGETGLVVLNQTPFYGESGGQVGDTGDHAGRGRCACA